VDGERGFRRRGWRLRRSDVMLRRRGYWGMEEGKC